MMTINFYRLLAVFFMFCWAFSLHAQHKTEFGQLTQMEKDFDLFEKDTTANAVFLYEYGNNFFEVRNNRIWLITRYHAKIKVLKEQGFNKANIEIPYYHNDSRTEYVKKIRALTHNGSVKSGVEQGQIFSVDVSERWSEKRFTFPKVQVGSILEYTYEVQSPFHFNLTGWKFQSDIPKVYTEYNAKIPGNWHYNRALIGELGLDVNEATLKKDCFDIPGISDRADCEELRYVMKDVPAFYETEEYMLAGSNYRSSLKFELSEYLNLRGYREKFTKTWKDVDKEFKGDKDIGRQLRKKNFFDKNVPPGLLTDGDALSKAQNIYSFVQDHFTWNEKYGIWHNNRVKKAFEEKRGNVAEINIALINLLNSAGIETDMMLMATRKRGLPKTNHPVMSDFNYIIAKTNIDGKDYLLDATDKILSFGMLPFRCLNYYGRVMNFNEESYWYDIVPEKNNKKMIRAKMVLDLEAGNATGIFDAISIGYHSLEQRRLLNSMTKEAYLENLEDDLGDDFYITSHTFKQEYSDDKRITEQFEYEIENILQKGDIYLNPFLVKFFTKNPFTATERHYPIDFGYTRNYGYYLSLNIPDGYQLKAMPESLNIALPGNAASLRFVCKEEVKGTLNVFFDLRLDATQYKSDAYTLIKEFFQHTVRTQTQSYIILEKI